MKSDPALDELVRRAEAAGGKVLGIRLPDAGPTPQCAELTGVNSARRPAKYRNKPTVYGGIRFDSKAEADYAAELDEQCAAFPGMWYVRQVTFRLGCPENIYRCDFVSVAPHSDPPVLAIDVKGVVTPKFARDVKLWKAYGPCPLHVVTRKGKGWETEIIEGGAS